MTGFDPDWVVAPGETLKECMDALGINVRIGAAIGGIERAELEGVIAGTTEITPVIASKLSQITMVGARMWLALEHNYRVGLAAGKTRVL